MCGSRSKAFGYEGIRQHSAGGQNGKQSQSNIRYRLLDYGATLIKICIKLDRTVIDRQVGNRLLRARTSVGVNYEEACGTQSKADFIHKLEIVLKEIRELIYWIELLRRFDILKREGIKEAINET